MTWAWLLGLVACAMLGWLQGCGWAPVVSMWSRLRRPKISHPAMSIGRMDAVLRDTYTLEYRDQLLARLRNPVDFGKLTKTARAPGVAWVEPVILTKETP